MPCDSRTISLPQLPAKPPAKPPAKHRGPVAMSKAAPWRAAVLIGVHVLIIAHVIHWLVAGKTLSPVEPSESMQTLEQGLVNAGAIFFLVAIASTLIFGRFFCGWGCHVVALQDLSSWLLKKAGLRPRPFRSRLLMLVPLGLALYMFVWPTFTRELAIPAFEALGWTWPSFLRRPPEITALHNDLIVDDFWATFPDWYIAVPFLFVIGFAVVYFLGNKGFCTYACPYGGFFAPAESLAPVRIRVTDDCEQCGHCTAVCTSNVRVHEEVRDFGMIVDPGCMKCMDCVTVCPNDALYVGLGRPAILAPKPKDERQAASRDASRARRKRQFDLSLPGEAAIALLWLALFLALRGFLDSVPMLMAAALAGIGAFVTWKAATVITAPDARFHAWLFKAKGRTRPAGLAFLALAAIFLGLAAWSGLVRGSRYLAGLDRSSLTMPADALLRPEFEAAPDEKAHAAAALAHLRRADSPAHGGIGWGLPPDQLVDVAFLQATLRQHRDAAATLERIIRVGHPTADLIGQVGQLLTLAGIDDRETIRVYADALQRHPALHAVRDELARVEVAAGRPEAADELWRAAPTPRDVPAQLAEARFYLWKQDQARGMPLLEAAADAARADIAAEPALAMEVAYLALAAGRADIARTLHDALHEPHGPTAAAQRLAAARLAGTLGLAEPMLARLAQFDRDDPTLAPGEMTEIAQLNLAIGNVDAAMQWLDATRARVNDRPWSLLGLASAYALVAQQTGNQAPLGTAIDVLKSAAEIAPHAAVIRHDLAVALVQAGRLDEAITELRAACEQTSENPLLPARLAELYQMRGQSDEAARWQDESRSRASR